MFSTAKVTSVSSCIRCSPSTNVAGVLPLPAERRVHDHGPGADPLGRRLGPQQLGPGVGRPDPLGEQQAGRVDREDRHAEPVGQPAQGVRVLADRVGPDHHLDAVEAEVGGHLEGRGAGLRVARGGGQGDLRAGHPTPSDVPSGPVQPMRQSSGPAIQSSRRRMMPSRSAHGQTCTSRRSNSVHRRLGHDGAGEQLRGPAGRDAGQLGAFVVGHRGELRHPLVEVGQAEHPRDALALLGTGRPGQPGQLLERLGRGDDVVGLAERLERAQLAGRPRPARACAAP